MNTASHVWHSVRNTIPHSSKQRVAIAAALAAIVVAVLIVTIRQETKAPSSASNALSDRDDATAPVAVRLSPDKIQSAQLHVAPCEFRELRDLRTVPGKITYNESHRLEIKAPAECVIKQVLVGPGLAVKKGDSLAILNCPEIGMARDAVAQCQSELALAQRESERTEQIAANVAGLLELLKTDPDPAEVEKEFDGKLLGEQRQQIMGAYSKLFLAESVARNTRSLGDTGAVSGRLMQEYHSNREVAKSAFDTACEESRFKVAQAREKGRAAVAHAERLLAVSRERLGSLGGQDALTDETSPSALSDLVLKAPFDGVIQEVQAVAAAHLTGGQPIFVLANTQTLWVSAEVPQRDWNALDGEQQHELTLRVPNLPDGDIPARVRFTEGKISSETHTISIVGELENVHGHLRPGMFAWVSVPMSQPQRVLTVRASAIQQHEQVKFVFVADGPDTFHRVDVTTGLETPDWVEITQGLSEGQNVVDAGAFALKSELLLEHEAG